MSRTKPFALGRLLAIGTLISVVAYTMAVVGAGASTIENGLSQAAPEVSSAASCYSRVVWDSNPLGPFDDFFGPADETLNIERAELWYDCATFELTIRFDTTTAWSDTEFDRLVVGFSDVERNDPDEGCQDNEFEAVVQHSADELEGALYFVPFRTCDPDDYVALGPVEVDRPSPRSISVTVPLELIGLPSPLYWVATLVDFDDLWSYPGSDLWSYPGSDHMPDPPSGAVDQRIRENLPTAGLAAVSRWYVSNRLAGGVADSTFDFAEVYDRDLYTGDWDGDGQDGVGSRRAQVFTLIDDIDPASNGWSSAVVPYGLPGDEAFVGDWDGDDVDTLAVRRGNVFFLRNSLAAGPADIMFGYGRATDVVLVGDWDGDGRDTFVVRRGAEIFVRNDFATAPAEFSFAYGRATDDFGVGDWDGDGRDTFIVRRAVIE